MEHIEKFLRTASTIRYPVTFDNAKILDFGCGSGTAVVEARAEGLDVFGCDIADGLGSAPRALAEAGVLRTIDLSNYKIPFKDDEFDMVSQPPGLSTYRITTRCFSKFDGCLKRAVYQYISSRPGLLP
jgi:SAM-dependent methyltransferase